MIKNYLKVAVRAILRNRLTSFINIMGLALAMASAVLIYLFITDELSYDRYHAKANRTCRVTREFFSRDGVSNLHLCTVAPPIGPLLKNDFGEIETMARTLQFNLVMAIEENGTRSKMASEQNVFMTEPDLFKILDINVISGDPIKSLGRPLTVMLSETAAKKYFGTTEVIGKQLKGGGKLDLEVTGVFKNFPDQTHWHPDFLISFSTLNDSTIYGRKGLETNWGNNAFSTYLVFTEGTDPKKIEARFPAFLDKHFGPYAKANFGAPADFVASKATRLTLQNIPDIHLRSHLDDEIETGGNINNVYMMAVIGSFIILIACFNFVNLSTARATKRAKEVGLRKTVGAFRNQLISQYLSESVLISFFGLVIALGFAWVALGWLNQFTHKHLLFRFIENWPLTLGLISFALLVGLLAGIYPAFVISAFKPALVLKGQQGAAQGKGGIRKALVVTQFAISVVLIIATLVTTQQLEFMNNTSLGFDKDRIVTLTYYNELGANYDAFYNEAIKSSTIKNVTRSSRIPTGRLLDSSGASLVKDGQLIPASVTLKMITTDFEFFNTYGIGFAAGRDFSKSVKTDDSLAYVVNEAAVKALGWTSNEEVIGRDFQYGGVTGKLIGVVNDFHFESLHERIVPMIFLPPKQSFYNFITVKIAGANFQEGLDHLQKVWKSFLPIRPFEYQFTSDRYQRLYEAEQRENQLFTIFSALAIFIASLGLFGLATFNTLQRIKEIGIRKVLGASVPNILGLLSKEIVILILIANAVAWPIAWFFMGKWLSSFAYHINMNILAYLLAAASAVLIALLTVSAQTLRAAMSNPANTLKYE
ncbi:MAG TPA: FtsX-like permease family protein [Cyclobacteriaceae bacterium]|nr:FtsX-like permease family protein [Cyclobacteriaceae bacterium]